MLYEELGDVAGQVDALLKGTDCFNRHEDVEAKHL